MPLAPQEFVSKWKRVTAREKRTYQERLIDLCHLVGHQTPNDYDPTGTRFAFEMGRSWSATLSKVNSIIQWNTGDFSINTSKPAICR